MFVKLPNILITGTPGVGKSTLGAAVAERTGLQYTDVSQLAKANGLFESYDEELQSYVIDEDRVIDELEDGIEATGQIIDYHSSCFFPERFFDLVVVLRCNNTVLYDRLAARGYSAAKILENIECEILNVLVDEARESYKEDKVIELMSETTDDMENNIEHLVQWIQDWKKCNADSVSGNNAQDDMQE